ncbi:hypothetical protein [Duganella sp. P38]|uniref:hypothetical protein n=1 Tax=Duganella sp. P38 TaxID=3423949 RepID=UPI003D7B40E0
MKDFADLKSLSKQLKEQAETRAAAEAQRIKQEKKQVVEANLFQSALGGVQRMPASDRYVPPSVPKASPSQPRRPAS